MSNQFEGTGNLGETPSIKFVPGKDGEQKVAELSIFFDRRKKDAKGEWVSDGGFWLRGSVWNEMAEDCARLLRKGTRVRVIGSIRQRDWTDKDTGEKRTGQELMIEQVYLALSRIETVTFKPKRELQGGEDAVSEADVPY